MNKMISISKACEMLGVSFDTLRRWDKDGTLVSQKTKGNHRRYLVSDIEKLQGKNEEIKEELVCIYCRVSSQDQKQHGDLDRQKLRLLEYCSEKQYRVGYILEEVCSGMKANRPKLNQLYRLAREKKINKLVIEHKDRLTRFMFDVFVEYFNSHDIKVEFVEEVLPQTFENELVTDLLTLMSSFSAKIYGKRSSENRKRKQK